jgi:predicted helicase
LLNIINELDYEIYIRDIIKNKYFNCWLWNDTPNHILLDLGFKINCDDIGCDIVCQNYDLSFIFIQYKNYSTTGCDNTISIHDLSGFYSRIAACMPKRLLLYLKILTIFK